MQKYYGIFWTICLSSFFSNQVIGQTAVRKNVAIEINGEIQKLAGTGGINAAQISQIDWNNDGIEDLFIFDRVGHIPISLIGESNGPGINYKVDMSYADNLPEFRWWALAIDYNKDGLDDIFTAAFQSGAPGITVYKAVLAGDLIKYEKQFDGSKDYILVPAGGGETNLYVSWEDTPALEDIDGDGDIDVLSFDPGGAKVTFFQNLSVENGWGADSLIFDIGDNCWGKFYESEVNEELFLSDDPNICSNGSFQGGQGIQLRHAGSTICVFDPNNDGVYDALIGDITSGAIVHAINEGNMSNAWVNDQDAHWPSNNTSVDLKFFPAAFNVDIDKDGLKDIIVGSNTRSFGEDEDVLWFYKNVGTQSNSTYELQQKDILIDEMLDLGSESNPAFADINNDGLMDIVIGSFASDVSTFTRIPLLKLLLNVGTSNVPRYSLTDEDYLGLSSFSTIPTWNLTPAFGDLDNDGDTDLIIGDINGELLFFENLAGENAPFNFGSVKYPYLNIDVGSSSAPEIYDVDNDGLNDLVIGERNANFDENGNCGTLTFFKNIGGAGNAAFNTDEDALPNTKCLGRVLLHEIPGLPVNAKPRFINVEGNELLLISGEDTKIDLYEVDQSNIYDSFTQKENAFESINEGKRPGFDVADIDNDGKQEIVVGNIRGGVAFYDLEFDPATSTKNSKLNEIDVQLYPNPVSNLLNFIITNLESEAIDYEIYNEMGQVVTQGKNTTQRFADMSTFQNGIYFIKISTSKGVKSLKFIKV